MRPDSFNTGGPRRRLLPAPGNILSVGLRTTERPEALISSLVHHGFKTHPDSGCIGGRVAGKPRIFQERLVDVKGFLRTYYFAIKVCGFGCSCQPLPAGRSAASIFDARTS